MKPYMRSILGLPLVTLIIALLPIVIRAEVMRVEITTRQDVLGGKAFGTVGAYEKLIGKVYFAVDPNNARNKIIADLEKAPKNRQGRVEFSSDLYVLKPKDPSKGNGVALFDILNRGNKQLLVRFDRARPSPDPTMEAEFGEGVLMSEGFTLVMLGWQFDVRKDLNPQLLGLDAPIATDNGRPITGWLGDMTGSALPWFITNMQVDSFDYAGSTNFSKAYLPLDLKDPNYRLTERERWDDTPRLIPREDWQFGRLQNGQMNSDPNWITKKGGFKPGLTYQLSYQTKDPRVAGVGFAAIRDLASAMKYKTDAVIKAQYVYTTGESQTGRYNRQIVYEGFTIDEQGRKAIDALFIRTGGSSLGSFNERFALPMELGQWTQTRFPIHYPVTTDAITGKRDGLGARIPAGLEPKIFLVDTGSEYWGLSRVAALRTLSIDGRTELPDPPNVRSYVFAGSKHTPSPWPPAKNAQQQLLVNPLEHVRSQRALLLALDSWARKGTEPPASKNPRLSDGTLVAQNQLKFPDVPGVKWPVDVPGGYRSDLPGPIATIPFLVSQLDSDGNEIGGIRLPEQAVPLGTYTSWAFRSESVGAPNTLVAYAGSYIPFAKKRADRERDRDPRPSVEERYSSKADYQRRVQEVAERLAQERYLRATDVKLIVEEAGKNWDSAMSEQTSQAVQ